MTYIKEWLNRFLVFVVAVLVLVGATMVMANGIDAPNGGIWAGSEIVLSPSTLTADVNDFTGCSGATVCNINPGTAARTITGISASVNGGGLKLCNVGTNSLSASAANPTLILANQSSLSTAANRFAFGRGSNRTVRAGDCIALTYTTTNSRWHDDVVTGDRIELVSPGQFAAAYTRTTGTTGIAGTAADFNNDGYPDFAVANYGTTTISVFYGVSAAPGTFSTKFDHTSGTAPISIVAADFNGDGYQDIADVAATSNKVNVFINTWTVDGGFAPKLDLTTGATPQGVAVGDFNGDGAPDIVTANNGTTTASVFYNARADGGTFNAKSDLTVAAASRGVATGRFNSDAYDDIVVSIYNGGAGTKATVFLTTGAGTFASGADITTGAGPSYVATGDFNNDGCADFVTANTGATISVFLNTCSGAGAFSAKADYTSPTQSIQLSLADYNADGWLDIGGASYGAGITFVMFNAGSTAPGTFLPAMVLGSTANAQGSVSADFDLNGYADLIGIHDTNTASVFLNQRLPGLTENGARTRSYVPLLVTANPLVTGIANAPLIVNPAAPVANGILMSLQNNGAARWSVDAEGDVVGAGTLDVTGAATLHNTGFYTATVYGGVSGSGMWQYADNTGTVVGGLGYLNGSYADLDFQGNVSLTSAYGKLVQMTHATDLAAGVVGWEWRDNCNNAGSELVQLKGDGLFSFGVKQQEIATADAGTLDPQSSTILVNCTGGGTCYFTMQETTAIAGYIAAVATSGGIPASYGADVTLCAAEGNTGQVKMIDIANVFVGPDFVNVTGLGPNDCCTMKYMQAGSNDGGPGGKNSLWRVTGCIDN